MKKLILLFILITELSLISQAQNPTRYPSRADYSPAVGRYFSSSNYHIGEATDYLIEDGFNIFYWQPVGASFFLTKSIGIELSVAGGDFTKKEENRKQFKKLMDENYSDNYYVDISYRDPYFYTPLGDIENFYIGPIYRIQKGQFQFRFKLLYGSETISTSSAKVYLKEKGSHNRLSLSYENLEGYHRNDCVSPSTSISYRFYKIFQARIDMAYSYSEINFSYSEDFLDDFSQVQSVNHYYASSIHKFSVGLGLTLDIGSIKSKSK